jgi:hypothetical protein
MWLSKTDRLDNKASSNEMKDRARTLPAESPATLHHKPCNVETKHFYLPHAYSYPIHTDKPSAYLMACHIPVLKLYSSTALTATNTNTTTYVCYLLFVQMKVTCEHFTDMSATTSIPDTFNNVSRSNITYIDSKTTAIKW